jgi:ribosomal protein S18 acetylase RimI-like enzyme
MEIKQLYETDFAEVIDLSLSIFKPKAGKNDRYHNINNWKEYFRQKGILLGAFVNNKLAGYLFCYEREPNKNTLHCWMAGVAEKHRRQGMLKKLTSKLTKILREKDYKAFTINTWPKKFPSMYAYLTKYGYEKYKEEEKEWEGKKTIKAFFRKNI